MNKKIVMISTLATVTLGLSGCQNWLYGGGIAPIYSGKVNQKGGYNNNPPIHSTTTPIERSGQGVTIDNGQNNPYGSSGQFPVRPSGVAGTAQSATREQINTPTSETQSTAVASANQGVAAAEQSAAQTIDEVKQSTEQVVETGKNSAASAVRPDTTTASAAAASAVQKAKPATTTSATRSLLQEASQAVRVGDYNKAASALERAHRIEPGNAKILYDIAQIRYAQGQYRQAESFASKAANYSKSSVLSKKIWRLLSNSRKALGNASGAAAAAQKAASF
ncbi:MAG: hypothetical protein CSA45_02200 [Gammaproteobacteria bacterium]|nr:MAG: hypothetical protein CSA45_02200 [Gammaproteobacteria bacterium]